MVYLASCNEHFIIFTILAMAGTSREEETREPKIKS
jgi:hypothetical protein